MLKHFLTWPSHACSGSIKRQGASASRGPWSYARCDVARLNHSQPATASGSVRRSSWTAARRIVAWAPILRIAPLAPEGSALWPPGAVIACTGRPRGRPCASDLGLSSPGWLPQLRAHSAMAIDFAAQASFLHHMANLDRDESRVRVNLGTGELPQRSPASNAPRNPSPLVPCNTHVCRYS